MFLTDKTQRTVEFIIVYHIRATPPLTSLGSENIQQDNVHNTSIQICAKVFLCNILEVSHEQ